MFTEQEKTAFLTLAVRPVKETVLHALDAALCAAPDAPPSQVAGGLLEWLFTDGYIPEGCREDFLYAIDVMQDWMMLDDPSSPICAPCIATR